MKTIQQNLETVQRKISIAAEKCGRYPKNVILLAVSKTKPVSAIQEAIDAGQQFFAENYVQEGVDKIQYFANSSDTQQLEWHFIGPLQSNKSRQVAEYFDWIHTIDRERIARRLNEQRPNTMLALNVLIQINISDEQSKSGISLEQLADLAAKISEMPKLTLRGLMAIPAVETDESRQLAVFKQVEQAFIRLQQRYPSVDTLSLGMTDDMAAAIAAGSTMVRIGTAIFGSRDYAR